MENVSLRVVVPPAEIGTVPLPLESGSCCVHLRCLPGASGAHLVLVDDQGHVVLRAEVKAAGGETLEVQVEIGEEGDLCVESQGRTVLMLPRDSHYKPPPPLPPVSPGASLDLVFVIDGTARNFTTQDKVAVSEPLIGHGAWLDHVERLSRFAEALAEGADGSRFAVLAFGDEALADTEAQDLRAFYVLHPPEEQRRFEPLAPSRLQDVLLALESTSGVDFVDALAEALRACRSLPWRDRTRRIVLVCGDSPGHSILYPLRPDADARVRWLDVDVEAEALHRAGIEIATLYFDPPANLGLRQAAFQRELFDGAREQYARLASLPTLAFELSRFDPDQAARTLRSREVALGRGATLGELIRITVPPAPGR
jgi:hypothetical protein